MKRKWMKFILTGVFVAGLVGSSYATSFADVKLDGELRVRGILVDNSDNKTIPLTNKGGFFEQRTRLNATGTVDENTTVFIQAQDSRVWGSEAGTTTTGNGAQGLDLSQGYVEMGNLFGAPLSVKLGRQAMAYGEHRLIGSLEWNNNARRFDAIKFTYKAEDVVNVDVFWAKVMDIGGDIQDDSNLMGAYAMLKVVPKNDIDVYLLDKEVGGGTNIYTIGARVKGDAINIDYNAEVAVQTGDHVKDIDKSANAYAVKVGYTVPPALGLRVGVEYDAATGDKASTAKKNEAFDNLYPTNHYLYGFTDDINWTNIKAISATVSIKPMDNTKVAVEYWKYSLAEENAAGEDDAGSEINIRANHEISKKVSTELAYVMRDAGKKIGAASYGGYGAIPADKSATFAYAMINVKFN